MKNQRVLLDLIKYREGRLKFKELQGFQEEYESRGYYFTIITLLTSERDFIGMFMVTLFSISPAVVIGKSLFLFCCSRTSHSTFLHYRGRLKLHYRGSVLWNNIPAQGRVRGYLLSSRTFYKLLQFLGHILNCTRLAGKTIFVHDCYTAIKY